MNLKFVKSILAKGNKGDRVLSGKDSVLSSIIKSKVDSFSLKVKQKVASTRLALLNKRINRVEASLKTSTGLVVLDNVLVSIDEGLKKRKNRLKEKYKFVLKPLKKIEEFSSRFDSLMNDGVDLEEAPLILKVSVGALVANVVLESTMSTTYSGRVLPISQPYYSFNGNVDWTSYATEVNGIKYTRKTVSGAAINNPMNLRPPRKTFYQGQVGSKEVFRKNGQSVGYFAIFSDPYYSFRAAANQILSYRDSDSWEWRRKQVGASKGSLTVLQMFNIYAPPEDYNSPNKYAQLVMQYSDGKIKPNDLIRIDSDKEQFKYLIRAMARVENSAIVDLDYLDKVWESMYGHGVPPLQPVLQSDAVISQSLRQINTSRREGCNNAQPTGSIPSNTQSRL